MNKDSARKLWATVIQKYMSRITLLIDHPKRDFIFSNLIQRCIGPTASIDLQDGYFTPQGPNFFSRAVKESVILTPSFHVKRTKYIGLRKKLSNSKLVVLHSEQFITQEYYDEKFNLQFFDEYNETVDLHLVWGEYFKKILIANGVSEEKIKIVGCPKFDVLDLVKSKFRIRSDSCILFIANFNLADLDDDDWEKYKLEYYIPKDSKLNLYYREARIKFIEKIITAALKFPEKLFLVRLHPAEQRAKYSCLENFSNIEISCESSLVFDLFRSHIVFQFDSSVIFESVYLGIPSYAIRFADIPDAMLQPPASEFIWYQTDQVENLIHESSKCLSSVQKINMEYYFSKFDNRCRVIADILLSLSSGNHSFRFRHLISVVGFELILKTLYCDLVSNTFLKNIKFVRRPLEASYNRWLSNDHAITDFDIKSLEVIKNNQ